MKTIEQNGEEYILLADEDLSKLKWNKTMLFELEYDDMGWILKKSHINTKRFIENEN